MARDTPEHIQECRKVFERYAVIALHITYGAMSRFALQKCSKLPKMLLANLLIARVMLSLRFINDEL